MSQTPPETPDNMDDASITPTPISPARRYPARLTRNASPHYAFNFPGVRYVSEDMAHAIRKRKWRQSRMPKQAVPAIAPAQRRVVQRQNRGPDEQQATLPFPPEHHGPLPAPQQPVAQLNQQGHERIPTPDTPTPEGHERAPTPEDRERTPTPEGHEPTPTPGNHHLNPAHRQQHDDILELLDELVAMPLQGALPRIEQSPDLPVAPEIELPLINMTFPRTIGEERVENRLQGALLPVTQNALNAGGPPTSQTIFATQETQQAPLSSQTIFNTQPVQQKGMGNMGFDNFSDGEGNGMEDAEDSGFFDVDHGDGEEFFGKGYGALFGGFY